MYQYTEFDKQFVRQRAAQYRDQLERTRAGTLGEEEFRPLRLQNGWYVQRHAPMLRVAVPYGELSSTQLRALGDIAHAVPLTLVAGIGHATLGHVNWGLLGALLIGSIPGIWIGAQLTRKMPEALVRTLLCVALVTAGLKVIY